MPFVDSSVLEAERSGQFVCLFEAPVTVSSEVGLQEGLLSFGQAIATLLLILGIFSNVNEFHFAYRWCTDGDGVPG